MTGTSDRAHGHPASLDPELLLRQCQSYRSRRAGPGGQHRNKVETGITLEHRPSGIRASATERRSQAQNRRIALFRLRLSLALDVRQPVSAEYTVSLLWRSRCRHGAIVCNPKHDDFPALLAEALDVLTSHGFEPRRATTLLGCSATQLVKLIKLAPPALAIVNERRTECGLHILK